MKRMEVCVYIYIYIYESRGTQDHILLSQFLRLPQPGGPGPRIYNPQEQNGPVIPPGTGLRDPVKVKVKVML
jgi:hypothetical protein